MVSSVIVIDSFVRVPIAEDCFKMPCGWSCGYGTVEDVAAVDADGCCAGAADFFFDCCEDEREECYCEGRMVKFGC